MNEHLSSSSHNFNITKSCYLCLELLYTNKEILSHKLKKSLYDVLVLLKLSFCSIGYYPCLRQVQSNRPQKIKNSFCKLICGHKKYYHIITPSINVFKLLKVRNIFIFHRLNFFKISLAPFVYNIYMLKSHLAHYRNMR